jgi:prevent-host-death family protein
LAEKSTMTITTLSSREFNQDTSRAKKAAVKGPVFITDRGKPAHVLLSIEQYQRLAGTHRKIADALAMPDGDQVEFDPPRVTIASRPADFS